MKKKANRVLIFLHEHVTGVKPPPGFLPAVGILSVLLVIGTFFYHYSESWSYLDSLYFSSITLATVGYGDLRPSTPASKIFTIFYIFMGAGFLSYIVYTFSRSLVEGRERQIRKMEELIKTLKDTNNRTGNGRRM